MPIAVTAEQLAIADSIGQWARRAGTIAAVRGLEASGGRTRTADPHAAGERWSGLAQLGIFSIGVPEDLGGAGGTAADVAAVAEQLAMALAPGPVMPTLLAGLVLARSVEAGQPAAKALLADVASGQASFGTALPASTAAGRLPTATQAPDGGLTVTGTASLVLGAGDSSHLLLTAAAGPGPVWFVIEHGQHGVHVAARSPVDFSRALADVTLDNAAVETDQVLSGDAASAAADLAVMLAASEAAGIATWCSQTATQYARTRQQFGRPIGSFQAVKHICAQMHCRAELAAATAWDAACAAGQQPDELSLAAAAAAALALDAAVDNAKDAIQVLGGIGFTWEHDAHLYLRRALALRQLLGGSAPWRARAVALAVDGVRRHSFEAPTRSEDEPAGASDIRQAARVVANAVSAIPPGQRRDGLAEVGYMAPSWPPPYGISASPAAQLIIDEELARAGLARPDLAVGGWAIPAIFSHGTPEQLHRFAGPTLRGEITWCQLFSEPEAGSDLAALRTRAVRVQADGAVPGGWLLTGQKVWTSLAAQADWAICLARTDPEAPKHKGISFFLVPMQAPGIEVRPLREMTGRQMFNEVFLDAVFVPDDCLVGYPGDGWRIARTTLATERVAMSRGGGLSADVEALLAAAAEVSPAQAAAAIDEVGARLAEVLALSVMDDRLAGAVARGAEPGMTSAVRKLLGVAHRQAVAETALTLQHVSGAAADGPAAEAVHQFLMTRCLSIAGGTSQILLSLVAERVLGLPRDEVR